MAQGLEMREAELTAVRASQRVFNEDGARELNETARTQAALAIEFNIDDALGDYTDEANHVQHVLSSSGLTVISENALYNYATELALMHDASGARRTLARARLTSASTGGRKGPIIAAAEAQNVRVTEMLCALAGGHWPQLLATARDTDRAEPALDAAAVSNAYPPTQIWPYIALGEAMTGNFTAARATIARTPGNCDACLRVRARMDAAQGNMGGAAWWFARAVTLAPSIPFAYTDWGAMLLGEGKYDDAIEKFRQANLKGPHYADPLEMWGEALMLQNRSDLALAKFEDANRYAPNWGRLHLEWGKALFYAGRKGEAKAQFAIATHLDLSTSDRASVAQWIARST
jgi:tetratricopeptide (TPR) repeat protein